MNKRNLQKNPIKYINIWFTDKMRCKLGEHTKRYKIRLMYRFMRKVFVDHKISI